MIVEGPVQHQGRGRIIKKNQENSCHAVELDFVPHGLSLGIDGAGNNIDHRHQNRQDIDGQSANHQHAIRHAQI